MVNKYSLRPTNHHWFQVQSIIRQLGGLLLILTIMTPVSYALSFRVNISSDFPDDNPGDGICRAVDVIPSRCSLRAAVMEANANPGIDLIILPGDNANLILNREGGGNTADVGDLDIFGDVTIGTFVVPQSEFPTINAQAMNNRIFDIHPGNTVTFQNLRMTGGDATGLANAGRGGAIFVRPSNSTEVNINQVDLFANTALRGGAIHSRDARININNSLVHNNAVVEQGGAITINGETLTINQSSIYDNINFGSPGEAIYIVSTDTFGRGRAVITNSTISENDSTGIRAEGRYFLELRNTTITNNQTLGLSALAPSDNADLIIQETLFADNGGDNCELDLTGVDISGTYSIADDSSCELDLANNLVNLENVNLLLSGPQQDTLSWHHVNVPMPGSLAIDGGTPNPNSCISTDQRGNSRPVDGNDDGFLRCDVGAIEVTESSEVPLIGTAPEGIYINTFDGDESGQETLLIRPLDQPGMYSIANLEGRGHVASISLTGLISIEPFGIVGNFINPDTAQLLLPEGPVSSYQLHRLIMTDNQFVEPIGQSFPINPIHTDDWNVNQLLFELDGPDQLPFTMDPIFLDSTLAIVPAAGGTQSLRFTQTNNGLSENTFQGTMQSRRDLILQIGTPGNNNDFALQTLPHHSTSLSLNIVGRGRFTDLNTFINTQLLEFRPDDDTTFFGLDRILVQQEFVRNNPLMAGDFNNSNDIDDFDRGRIIDHYGLSEADIDYNILADLDNNSLIDIRDTTLTNNNPTTLMPINSGHSGSWFNTNRNGEGWNIALLPGGEFAIIAFFSYTPDSDQQAWIVGLGRVQNNEIHFLNLNITSGAAFGAAFDPDDVIRSRWGDLRLYFTDCNTGQISYSADNNYNHDARTIQRLTALAGLDCEQPDVVQPEQAVTRVTGSWFNPSRDGEGWVMEALSGNLVVLYWYTYGVSGDRQYWLGGVGSYDPNTSSVQFDELSTTAGGQFGDGFNADEIERINWGSATFIQSNCNNATFSFNSSLAGFGSQTYNLTRLTSHDGLVCNDIPE